MSKWVKIDDLDYKALRYLSGKDLRAALDAVPGLEFEQCKDCRYYYENAESLEDEMTCKWRADESPDPDDFCSIGESKEGSEDADK